MVKALLFAVAGFFVSTVSVMAQSCGNLPVTLTNGTNANANDVMNDLNHLRTCISNLTVLPVAPTGRLTLTSGAPVMTGDATNTSIYYTPYTGSRVQIYDGTVFVPFTFAELTATATQTDQVANGVYDLFVFSNPGIVTLAFGPAWQSVTSRGTGATELEQFQGLWTNKNIINLKSAAISYDNRPARTATYVGTVAITANPGQMAMQFKPPLGGAGGNNNWLGVWNAYNRVTVRARSIETQSFWDYSTQTFRPVNNSLSNRINWVDGLRQSRVMAQFTQLVGLTNSGAIGAVGWDSTTVASDSQSNSQNLNPSGTVLTAASRDFNILLGRHYVQALEKAQSGSPRFYGSTTMLEVELDM
jgi:hypothetical protein